MSFMLKVHGEAVKSFDDRKQSAFRGVLADALDITGSDGSVQLSVVPGSGPHETDVEVTIRSDEAEIDNIMVDLHFDNVESFTQRVRNLLRDTRNLVYKPKSLEFVPESVKLPGVNTDTTAAPADSVATTTSAAAATSTTTTARARTTTPTVPSTTAAYQVVKSIRFNLKFTGLPKGIASQFGRIAQDAVRSSLAGLLFEDAHA